MPSANTITKFLEWMKNLGGTEMLFRGLSKESYLGGERGGKRLIYSSLCRRLDGGPDGVNVPEKLFIAESTRLLSDAKMQWHHRRDGKELQDLELTAELQHYEAATCLIDFTRNPLLALWFACGGFSSSDGGEEGVIVAFEAGDPSACKTIDSGDIEKSIDELLQHKDGIKKPYVWNPSQGQNTRITAQQSAFVFGSTAIEIAPSHVCYVGDRKNILKKLSACGITKKSLFGGDFDGFARILNSFSSPAADYYRIAREKHANGEKSDQRLAVLYYDKALEKGERINIYYHRGLAKLSLGDHEGVIADYDRVIEINPKNAGAYNNRGIAKDRLGNYEDAIADYDQAIEINPQYAIAYNNRGVSNKNSGDLPNAIADYDQAIEINPQYATAYNNRGNTKDKLGDKEGAIADYDRAIEINPQYATAYNNRGNTKDELGDKEGAKADLQKAAELRKNSPQP